MDDFDDRPSYASGGINVNPAPAPSSFVSGGVSVNMPGPGRSYVSRRVQVNQPAHSGQSFVDGGISVNMPGQGSSFVSGGISVNQETPAGARIDGGVGVNLGKYGRTKVDEQAFRQRSYTTQLRLQLEAQAKTRLQFSSWDAAPRPGY